MNERNPSDTHTRKEETSPGEAPSRKKSSLAAFSSPVRGTREVGQPRRARNWLSWKGLGAMLRDKGVEGGLVMVKNGVKEERASD